MSKNNGGTAFPILSYNYETGLTKRDFFAAAAMQGLLGGIMGDSDLHETPAEWIKSLTETAYEFSDAMLKERNK